jgi:hypothetical protein
MPKWASRITLEIVNVRRDQLCAITEADAIAEGMPECELVPALQRFPALWDSINGERFPWIRNPDVWAIAFKTV